MPWLPKALKKTVASSASASASASGGKSQKFGAEQWHREVNSVFDVIKWLDTGYSDSLPRLENLKQKTSDYLTINNVDQSDWDQTLGLLVKNHAQRFPENKDLAVYSCLHALSSKAATLQLISLATIRDDRYLRGLSLIPQVCTTAISRREIEAIESILNVFDGQETGFQALVKALKSAGQAPHTVLLPKPMIRKVLISLKNILRLPELLEFYFQSRHFLSAQMDLSLLKTEPQLIEDSNMAEIIDEHLPSWRGLLKWQPDINRIRQWQYRRIEDSQKLKLLKIYDLDGPDPDATDTAFRISEPKCYENVNISPQNCETLERFLQLLYRSHALGPSALDLFIYLCVDNRADEKSMDAVEQGLDLKNDTACKTQLLMTRVLEEKGGLNRRVKGVIQALADIKYEGNYPGGPFLELLMNLVAECRAKFMERLHQSTGEYLGAMTYDLGSSIMAAAWMHDGLPRAFLASVEAHPPRSTLEIVFRQVEEDETVPIADSRLKMYLAATLGGASEYNAIQISSDNLKKEVEFWKGRPDLQRKGLAKNLSKLRYLDYGVYTACLEQMFSEPDLYVEEMRLIMHNRGQEGCLNFAGYLGKRRKLNQLDHDSWLLVLNAMMTDQGPTFLESVAQRQSPEDWMALAAKFVILYLPIVSKLPGSNAVITCTNINWWNTLSTRSKEVNLVLRTQKKSGDVSSMYFPESGAEMTSFYQLLTAVRERRPNRPVVLVMIRQLASDWSNIKDVCRCSIGLDQCSPLGKLIVERTLRRNTLSTVWPVYANAHILRVWRKDRRLTAVEKNTLRDVASLLNLFDTAAENVATPLNIRKQAKASLETQYEELIGRAQQFQSLLVRFRRESPTDASRMLRTLRIVDSGATRFDLDVPDDLADAVEVVGVKEYVLSIPLTEVKELRKQAMGIPTSSSLLIVRLKLDSSPKFCIHFSDSGAGHVYYSVRENRLPPTGQICSQKPSLFTFFLGKKLFAHCIRRDFSLRSIYALIEKSIKQSPSECLLCFGKYGAKLWKPTVCGQDCSLNFKAAPLEIRLHNLLIDPLAMDLLLTAVYAAAAITSGRDANQLDLLPACPIPKSLVRHVIDSFRPMSTYAAAPNLSQAIGSDLIGQQRHQLLAWICFQFRGFIMTAPAGYRVPSMPGVTQFLILNSAPDKEKRFNQALIAPNTASGAVFHGTALSRLFAILTGELKNLSQTPYMVHGSVSGPGIYVSDDQGTSVGFASSGGQSWRNSSLSNMSALLGCELANWTAKGTHVVTQEDRVNVKYVFMLPQSYTAPPRQHVAPAMQIAFSNLRAGLT